MNTTPELLEAVKRRHGLTSDYQLARLLKWDRALVSLYRTGRRKLTEPDCLAVADALGADPAAVLALVQAERAKDDATRKAWTDAVRRLGGIAAAVVAMIGGNGPTPPSATAAQSAPAAERVCVMSTRAGARRRTPAKRRTAAGWLAPLARLALAPASA